MTKIEGRPTEGMPDMMPKGTVDNPPQKEPQNIPDRMIDQPFMDNSADSDNTITDDSNVQDINIPLEYESVVEQITEAVYNGFVCYLNPDTLEIEQVSEEGFYNLPGAEYAELNEDMIDEYGLNYMNWDTYIRLEPFSRNDIINRIDQFIKNMDDETLKNQLEEFEDKEELLRQFPSILERTGHTLDWDMFYRNEIESYVKSQVMDTIRKGTNADKDIYTAME